MAGWICFLTGEVARLVGDEGAWSNGKLVGGSHGLANLRVRSNSMIKYMACEEERGAKMSGLRISFSPWNAQRVGSD